MSDEQAKAVAAAVSDTAKYLIRWAAGIGIGVFVLGWCVPSCVRYTDTIGEGDFELAYDLGYKTGLVSDHKAPSPRNEQGYRIGDGPVSPYRARGDRDLRWCAGYADGQVVKAGMPKERK